MHAAAEIQCKRLHELFSDKRAAILRHQLLAVAAHVLFTQHIWNSRSCLLLILFSGILKNMTSEALSLLLCPCSSLHTSRYMQASGLLPTRWTASNSSSLQTDVSLVAEESDGRSETPGTSLVKTRKKTMRNVRSLVP